MSIHLERLRAGRAWELVRLVAREHKDLQKRYRSQARGGPAVIQRNGLAQFLAFLSSKGFKSSDRRVVLNQDKPRDHADGMLYQHLGNWLAQQIYSPVNAPDLETILPAPAPRSTRWNS